MAGPLGYQGGNFGIQPLELTLGALQAFQVPPGEWVLQLGRYHSLEFFDNNLGFWRATDVWKGVHVFASDGNNYRVINRTGGPMGAILTNLGNSAYTSAPAVAVSAGGSLWRAILGGALNTTVTVTTAGAYNYPPTLIFPPAPAGGITPSGFCVLAAGAISSVTITNRGAGLLAAPIGTIPLTFAQALQFNFSQQGNNVLIVQDPRDTAAGAGKLTFNAVLANAGNVSAVICTDPGNVAQTALPTLTFSGGGGANAAATVIMNWVVTGFTVGTAGVAYGNAQPFQITGAGLRNQSVDAAGDVNPDHNLGLTNPRNFLIEGTSTAGGAVTATGTVIDDAGWGIQRVPDAMIVAGGGALPTTAAAVTMTVGGITDTSWLQLRKF